MDWPHPSRQSARFAMDRSLCPRDRVTGSWIHPAIECQAQHLAPIHAIGTDEPILRRRRPRAHAYSEKGSGGIESNRAQLDHGSV
jgi:hypothetical protein